MPEPFDHSHSKHFPTSQPTSTLPHKHHHPNAQVHFYHSCMCVQSLQSCPTLCSPRAVARQAPLSMGFSRQEYWRALPCPPPGDLPHPGFEPTSPTAPTLQADSLLLRHQKSPLITLTSLSSVQFCSVDQSCLILCNPMNHSMPGLPVHHKLLEFTQTHVHRVSDAIQPSHPLSSPSPPAPNPSQHQGLFQ